MDHKRKDTFKLFPYQKEIALAILDSVYNKRGLTFTVEIARQGGKNEISARIERQLLTQFQNESKNLIKCSPTFRPQAFISMQRLKQKLNESEYRKKWTTELENMIRVGEARAIFLSADTASNVVGNTAHLLLEVDEAQDVSEEKYSKEFRPMGSTTNVTNVLYGTTWDDSTLLEKMKQINLELERKDGIKRHFRYDWEEVAKYNPEYRAYVLTEKERLGENHSLFLSQYRLLPIHGGGGFLNSVQKALLQGIHGRLSHSPQPRRVTGYSYNPNYSCPVIQNPEYSKIYVAGIDLAGEAESFEDDFRRDIKPRVDSTVITIGEVEINKQVPRNDNQTKSNDQISNFKTGRSIKIVEHYAFTGIKHPDLYARMVDIIKNVWQCKRVVVDATGIGQPVASFLRQELGSRIVPFTFTAPAKTELGFNLLSAINSGSLKMYAGDNSAEFKEFWFEMEKAKSFYRPSRTMNFYVDPCEGHDDYLMSLALLVEAANAYTPSVAYGRLP